MHFPGSVTIDGARMDSVESAQRFLLEHPDHLERKHWQYIDDLDDVALRGGIRAAWNAILFAAKQDELVHLRRALGAVGGLWVSDMQAHPTFALTLTDGPLADLPPQLGR